MSWPLASHFSAMLQNPRIAFRDPRLQRAEIEKDERNQPRPWAGAFAVVYKGIDPQRQEPFAVRVFTTESPERHQRYELMSAYLKARRLKCLVDFEYRDRGIRSAGDGKWYPLILMEWVQGETLFKWLRARCLENSTAAVAQVAEGWLEVVKELADASLSHGDLQHANVMITDSGEIKLVDYDCMCVPALVGRRNLEVGVEPYQHPGRNESTLLSLDLDQFSALLIYVGLRALALDPGLWLKYVESPGYDKLLFRKEDLLDPDASPLCRDLMQLEDPEIRELSGQLFDCVRLPMDQVPPLGQLANSYAKIEQLLMRQQWDAAVKLLNRRGQFRDAPSHLKLLIRQAYEHTCRRDAWRAVQQLPAEASEPADRALVQAWNEKLFAGYEPAEQQRGRLNEARRRVMLLDRLRYLIQHCGTMTLASEKGIVEVAAQLPPAYRHSLSAWVEEARRRVVPLTQLERAVCFPNSESAIAAAWQAVLAAKCENLVDAAWRPRIELAQQRAPHLRALAEIPKDLPAPQRDRRILDAWHVELLADCPEAERWRLEYERALSRKDAVARLQAAVEERNDLAITQAMQDPSLADLPLPADWAAVVRKAQERVERSEALLAALRDGEQAEFYCRFDARLIRLDADRFAAHQALLCQWLSAAALTLETLGLQPAVGRVSLLLADDPAAACRVCWTWPPARFAERCLLGVADREPALEDTPESLTLYHRLPLDRQAWESAGGSRLLPVDPACSGAWVVVWAVVDLGFRSWYSRPLVLGRLPSCSPAGRQNWRFFGPRRGPSARAKQEDGRP